MNNNKNTLGFSLVEALIVLTIVGVISAVAIPKYKEYSSKGKIVESLNMADGYSNKAYTYYNSHNSFPNNTTQLGLENSVTPYSLSPYVYSYGVNRLPAAPGQCAAVNFYLYLSDYGYGKYGVDPTSYMTLLYNYTFDVDGTLVKKCFYTEWEDPAGVPTGRDFLPQCDSIDDEPDIIADINAQCP